VRNKRYGQLPLPEKERRVGGTMFLICVEDVVKKGQAKRYVEKKDTVRETIHFYLTNHRF